MNILQQNLTITTRPRQFTLALTKATGRLMTTAVMLSVLSLVAGRVSAAGIPAESMRDWTIVVSADAIESEKYAAEEIRTFFEQATGIALPIANETAAADGGRIFVGAGEEMRASAVGFDTVGLGPDDAAGSNMGSILDLVNEVADVVAVKHPDVLVGTLAYIHTRKPPVNVVPRRNVQIQLSSYEACQIHALDDPDCPRNTGFRDDLTGWGKLTENIYIWHYTANFHSYLIPLPLLRSVGAKIRFSVENNAKGLFMQGPASGANLGGLRHYLICNLLWDPTRDENQLIAEFLRLHYGSQAGAVREYIKIIHDTAEASGKHEDIWGGVADYGITPIVIRRALTVLENAMAATDDDILRTRLERETLGCYAAFVNPVARPLVWAHAPVATEADKRAARPYIGKFLELCRKHNATMYSGDKTVAFVEQGLRELYGLDAGEAWLPSTALPGH